MRRAVELGRGWGDRKAEEEGRHRGREEIEVERETLSRCDLRSFSGSDAEEEGFGENTKDAIGELRIWTLVSGAAQGCSERTQGRTIEGMHPQPGD